MIVLPETMDGLERGPDCFSGYDDGPHYFFLVWRVTKKLSFNIALMSIEYYNLFFFVRLSWF
jgi:hypothetical protein